MRQAPSWLEGSMMSVGSNLRLLNENRHEDNHPKVSREHSLTRSIPRAEHPRQSPTYPTNRPNHQTTRSGCVSALPVSTIATVPKLLGTPSTTTDKQQRRSRRQQLMLAFRGIYVYGPSSIVNAADVATGMRDGRIEARPSATERLQTHPSLTDGRSTRYKRMRWEEGYGRVGMLGL